MDRRRDFDGCPGAPAIVTAPSVRTQSWSSCRGNAEVRYVLIHDHGHEWPGGGRSRLPATIVGPVNPDAYDATPAIWRFFERWRRL